ncbi:MAG TPA: hypothetical protein VGG33_16805, partial [Polyangia bacterium]
PAVDYLEKAAARALRDSANEDAIKLLMEARELAAQLPEALRPNLRLARWERQLGEAYQGIGNLAASRAHLLAALDRLERPLPLAGRKLANQLTKEAARQFVHRVRTRPPGEEQALQREIADALYAIGYVLYYEGKYEPLLCSTVAAVNLYEGLPPTPALALTYVNIAATFALIPVRWGVNKYFGLAAATLAQVPDAAAESHYELLRSSYALGLGDYEGAGRAAERAAALAESAGYRKRWEEAIGVRSGIALTRGDFVETDRWCEAYLSSALARKDAQIATIGYLNRAQRRVWRQELEPAEHELALAEAGIATAGKLEQIWARALRSSIALARGQSDAAEALAKEAADLLQATQPSHVFGLDAYARIAEVRLALLGSAATPAARKTRKAAAKASLRMLAVATKKFPIAQPSQLCHLGTSQWLDHEPRKAAATWRTGRTVAQHLQMPQWELRLLDALADAGAASSEEMRDRDLLRARLGLPAVRLPGAAN